MLDSTKTSELKALGFAKISARGRDYAQNELAVEAFKKKTKIRARLPKGVEIELWWQGIGQKNKLTADGPRGTRPRAPRDQRTEWAYIFGAICPAKGKGAGLVMPWCDTDAMAASRSVPPSIPAPMRCGRSGRLALDAQAGDPRQHTVLALPPRSPELNPVENVAIHADNWLSNRKTFGHRRAVLPSLEQPHRPTEDHAACANGRMGSDQ